MKRKFVHSGRVARGFTLLELLVVIVIIGLLAAFVAPKYFGQIGRSKVQIAKAQIESFEKALDQYRIDTDHYPKNLVDLVAAPSSEPNWRGPYLKKGVPADPWGKAYLYKDSSSVEGRDYEISSGGADGQIGTGGTGDSADINSWTEVK